MSKTSKLIEAAARWRSKHADEGLNLKGLEEAFAKYQEARGRSDDLKSQLKVVKQQNRQLSQEVVTVFKTVKSGRKLAVEAHEEALRLEAKKPKEEAKAIAQPVVAVEATKPVKRTKTRETVEK